MQVCPTAQARISKVHGPSGEFQILLASVFITVGVSLRVSHRGASQHTTSGRISLPSHFMDFQNHFYLAISLEIL